MATNTLLNVGIRRNFSFGQRNFEPSGLVPYAAARDKLEFMGTTYANGATLPFDVAGTSYSVGAIEKLQFYWNQSFINPLS